MEIKNAPSASSDFELKKRMKLPINVGKLDLIELLRLEIHQRIWLQIRI